ncbi:MAG: hypothetical protein M1834_008132 [Cirrosporium novae-zelandiae]|nr:MAG: hypothetical protein M1834_008132 [Cirrosporium novae-zelandiae]
MSLLLPIMPIPLTTSSLENPSNSEALSAPAAETTNTQHQTTNNTTDAEVSSGSAGAVGQQKSEAELAAEKLYEERMEEEYAKREGGA